jgi:hypothetical protein
VDYRPTGGAAAVTSDAFEYDAADGEAVVCDRCGQPFTSEMLLALHRGQIHADDLTAAEREAFETAYDDEQEQIRRFRLKALGSLILIYFGFLMVYALV